MLPASWATHTSGSGQLCSFYKQNLGHGLHIGSSLERLRGGSRSSSLVTSRSSWAPCVLCASAGERPRMSSSRHGSMSTVRHVRAWGSCRYHGPAVFSQDRLNKVRRIFGMVVSILPRGCRYYGTSGSRGRAAATRRPAPAARRNVRRDGAPQVVEQDRGVDRQRTDLRKSVQWLGMFVGFVCRVPLHMFHASE